MSVRNKKETELLIEHWKLSITESTMLFEDVLQLLQEEEKYLNEVLGFNKEMIIGTLLTSLFVLSPKVSNANPRSFNSFARGVQTQVCSGGPSGTCSVSIKPRTSLSKVQQAIRAAGLKIDISSIDGMSENDAVDYISQKLNSNISNIESALRSETAKTMAGIDEDISHMSIKELIKTYKNSPGGDMFVPVLSLIKT